MSSKRGRPINISGPIGELASKIGGVETLASHMDVSERTIRHWASKTRNPSGPSRKILMQLAESYSVRIVDGEI